MGDIAIIVTSSRLQVTLRVETCVELELSLPESDLEPSLLKTSPCKYCHRFRFGRAQLEAHLKENEICASLYKRAEKVRNLDAVLVKQFKCISCSSNGTFQLKRHLGFV